MLRVVCAPQVPSVRSVRTLWRPGGGFEARREVFEIPLHFFAGICGFEGENSTDGDSPRKRRIAAQLGRPEIPSSSRFRRPFEGFQGIPPPAFPPFRSLFYLSVFFVASVGSRGSGGRSREGFFFRRGNGPIAIPINQPHFRQSSRDPPQRHGAPSPEPLRKHWDPASREY